MTFTIVPPSKPPRPVAAEKLVRNGIWRVSCLVVTALALEQQQLPPLYLDFLLRQLVRALRDGADQIERTMAQHAAERIAEHERALEARRNGGGS